MRVILDKSVLQDDSTDLLALLAVFQLCRQSKRHFLLVDAKSLETWCTRLGHPKNLRDSLQRIANDGRIASPARRSPEIRIVGNEFSWSARIQRDNEEVVSPRIRAVDAVKLLQAPLRLLVENGRNDGAFLLRMALGNDRARLEHAIEMGWVIFENAGGLGEMKKVLAKIATLDDKKPETWVRWLRLWVMFDRDAHKDDRTRRSVDSVEVSTSIEQLQRRIGASWTWPGMKCLERRAIENYLPKQGLNGYVDRYLRDSNESRRRKGVYEAFFHQQMEDSTGPDRLRASYNMPKGFKKDTADRAHPHDVIYQGLDQQRKDALHEGFGDDVKKLWVDEDLELKEEWIAAARKGPIKAEINGMLKDILERI